GGKRSSLDAASNKRLFSSDGESGWIVETETDQNLTGTITLTVEGIIVKSDGTTRRTINITANAPHFTCSAGAVRIITEYLKFTCSNATRTSACAYATGSA